MDNGSAINQMPDEVAKAYLAAVVDSSDEAIISTTAEGRITTWSRGAEMLFGYGAELAIGRDISLVVPKERQQELDELSRRVLRGERVERLETVRLTKEGKTLFVSVTFSPILTQERAVAGILSTARDIGDRVTLERSLRESEQRYRTLVEMAPDAVVVHQEGRFVYANCAALGIYGARSLEQLQQHQLVDLVHPQERDLVRARLRLLLEGEEIPLREFRLRRLDGEEIAIEASSTLIDYQGRPSIQIIARDVTFRKGLDREREKMLQEIAFERSRLETVLSQMPVGVLIAEAGTGRVIHDNEASHRIFGYDMRSLQRISDYDRLKIFGADGAKLKLRECPVIQALNGETVIGVELKIERGDGTPGYVSVNAAPIRDASGSIVAGLATFNDITGQKEGARALFDSEQRLNLALDAAGMGFCDIAVQTGSGIWSRRYFILLGYPVPEQLTAPARIEMWQERIHPADRDRVLGEIDKARREQSFLRSEHRILRADNGEQLWVNVMGRFLCQESGELCRFLGVIFDVSERKSAEEALSHSERAFRLMADSMPQIAWTSHPDGSLEYLNAQFQSYTGIDRSAPLVRENLAHPDRLALEVVHPEDLEVADELWKRSLESGRPYQGEYRLRRADGVYHWHLGRAIAVRDEAGRIVKWYGTATDINELRQAQELLRASEATLKLAVESTGLGILDRDLRTGKEQWSEIAKRLFGLPPEAEVDQGSFGAGLHPDDRDRVTRLDEEARRPESGGSYKAEFRSIGLSDGKPRWLTARGRVHFDSEGRPLRMLVACLDITEIVQAEKALKEEITERLRTVEELHRQEQLLIRQGRFAAMGEMIGNIAHQWRQPLNTLALIVQELPVMYQRDLFSKEYLDGSVSRAMQVINYMSKTIDGFRNFFSPAKEKETFTAAAVVARTVSIVEAAFNELNLKIEMSLDREIELFGSPNEFSQVVLNILVNAKDAILARKIPNPKVVVRLFREEERAVLTIADNAGGIPEEIMDKIFDPYFTTKGPDKGTGIGLFMSRTIIEKNMNGSLTVRNTGAGAEFRIEV